MDKTVSDLIKGDVYEEDFLIAFHTMLEKFANEYDDMAHMTAIKKAGELLKLFNQ